LELLKNPEHEEYEETLKWLMGDFDPEHFDPKDVKF
jgi:Plasmid pRiA4b ORF-3-like protein